MKFLRNLLASILGSLFAFGILFVMFLIFISLASMEEVVTVKPRSVLEISLPDPISEYTGSDPSDPFAGLFEKSTGLDEILHAIQIAKNDRDIRGISIHSTFLQAGLSQTRAIRAALKDFRDSGKFVYAYGDFYLQKDYYLASVADSVFLNPAGGVNFRGLSAEVLFFKELQEKSGLKMEVIRHGKYKSAVEPFLADEMSDSNREQISELIGSLWNSVASEISEDRGLSREDIDQIADSLGGRKPEYALKAGLVDGVIYEDQYEALLKEASGTEADREQSYISVEEYMKVSGSKRVYRGSDKIAVIFGQGEMYYGEGGPEYIGQGLINNALIKAREDEDVKAVVLRLNTPGGSALTSDIIWREIKLTEEVKPVVVSMGDLTASAGYYIASGATRIFAEPTTVTGSIGVFAVIPNVHEFAGKIGINAEQVATHKNSVEYSLFEPMGDNFRAMATESIEDFYEQFLERVAEGRNMRVEEVDKIAQGRVWSGSDAQNLGLVDSLGGLDDAIAAAAELGGTDNYSLRKYPRYKSGFTRFMEDFSDAGARSREKLLRTELGTELYGLYREMRSALDQKGLQARMPFNLNIR